MLTGIATGSPRLQASGGAIRRWSVALHARDNAAPSGKAPISQRSRPRVPGGIVEGECEARRGCRYARCLRPRCVGRALFGGKNRFRVARRTLRFAKLPWRDRAAVSRSPSCADARHRGSGRSCPSSPVRRALARRLGRGGQTLVHDAIRGMGAGRWRQREAFTARGSRSCSTPMAAQCALPERELGGR